MSQKIFRDIVADVDTGTLLAGWLNDFRDALISGLSGPTRPPELKGGGMWVDTSDSANNIWTLKLWLEDSGIESSLLAINTQSGEVFLPSVAGTKAEGVSVEAFGATDFGNVQTAIEQLVAAIKELEEDVGELGPALSDLTDEVDNIVRLPTVTAADDGKVATVDEDGNWIVKMPASGLPVVTVGDAGKVLTVDSSGNWVADAAQAGGVKTVADQAARDDIPVGQRTDRMLVYQADKDILWVWKSAEEVWDAEANFKYLAINTTTASFSTSKSSLDHYHNYIQHTSEYPLQVNATATPFGNEAYQDGTTVIVENAATVPLSFSKNAATHGLRGGVKLESGMVATFMYLASHSAWFLVGITGSFIGVPAGTSEGYIPRTLPNRTVLWGPPNKWGVKHQTFSEKVRDCSTWHITAGVAANFSAVVGDLANLIVEGAGALTLNVKLEGSPTNLPIKKRSDLNLTQPNQTRIYAMLVGPDAVYLSAVTGLV